MEDSNIESNLLTTIVTSDIKDIGIDILEISLDSVLDEGILKEIPILGSIAKIYSAGTTIQGKIFEKKILKFLFETDKIATDKKKKFEESLKNVQYRNEVGEKILVILDKLDDIKKASVIGRLFKKYIEEEISMELFQRFASTIINSFLPDIKKLYKYEKSPQWRSFTSTSLENVGLVHMSFVKAEKYNGDGEQIDGSEYTLTDLGLVLLKLQIL